MTADKVEDYNELKLDETEIDENKQEKVDVICKIFASRLNGPLTSIGKFAMDWLVWNTDNNIYWNFDLNENSTNNNKHNHPKYIAFTMDDSTGRGLNGTIEFLDSLKT